MSLHEKNMIEKIYNVFPEKKEYDFFEHIILVTRKILMKDYKKDLLVNIDSTDDIIAFLMIRDFLKEDTIIKKIKEKEEANEAIPSICKVLSNVIGAIYEYDKDIWMNYLSNIYGIKLSLNILLSFDSRLFEEQNYKKQNILNKLNKMDIEKYQQLIKSDDDKINEIINILKGE